MSEPRNDMEFFIHECDILASRNDIDWIVPDKLTGLLNSGINFVGDLPNIKEYKLTFGKHAGMTLIEISEADPSYIRWAKENLTREPEASLLKQL